MRRQRSPASEASECDGCGVFLPAGRWACEGCLYQWATGFPGAQGPWWLRIAAWVAANPGHTVGEICAGTGYKNEPGKRLSDARDHGWEIIAHDGTDPKCKAQSGGCEECRKHQAGLVQHPTYTARPPVEAGRGELEILTHPPAKRALVGNPTQPMPTSAPDLDERPPAPLPENSDQLMRDALAKLELPEEIADKIKAAA